MKRMTLKQCRQAISHWLGIHAGSGGLIYDRDGRPICQGWGTIEGLWIERGWIVQQNAPHEYCVNWQELPCPRWMDDGTSD